MKMKALTIFFLLFIGTVPPLHLKAANLNPSHRILQDLVYAIFKKDERMAKSLVEPSVKIPEIRENTPIRHFQSIPSPLNNTKILIGYFEEEYFNDSSKPTERIAFIWEVSITDEKISNIKVVSDVANPYMNELIITKEYKEKFNKVILVPAYFPFKATHVQGKVIGNKITLEYRNAVFQSLLKIEAEAHRGTIIKLTEKGFSPLLLGHGKKGFIKWAPPSYQLVFLHDGMRYIVRLEGVSNDFIFSINELVQIAESMFPKEYGKAD